MPSLPDLLQQGSTNLWIFIPTELLLGALHGLVCSFTFTRLAALTSLAD
ncbi:MAG: hypothetical protein JWL66_1635 [Sphingomonadales bacterium]|nr:hypothetical protein [Sphingomonadales bacterium]